MVFCDIGVLETVRKAALRVGLTEDKIVVLDREAPGLRSMKSLIEEGRKRGENQAGSWQVPEGKLNSDICTLLCFSSGK